MRELNASVLEAIDRSVLCWLATVDAEGMPNVSPKEIFTASARSDGIAIANIASPVSARNLAGSPKACVSFVDVFRERGFKVQGSAIHAVPGDEAFEEHAEALRALAGPDFVLSGVMVLKAERISIIRAPSYAVHPARTEDERVAMAHRTYGVRALT